jgi:hypothetical protein
MTATLTILNASLMIPHHTRMETRPRPLRAYDTIPGVEQMVTHELLVGMEEKRAALESVLRSQTFARSDQLKRFLRYICEMEIAGRSREISEYTIGIEALGRPQGYTPHDDSSVRSRAYALRQKLQEYYEKENPLAEVRIELRKGSYTPSFLSRAEAPVERIAPASGQVWRIDTRLALAGVVLALVAGAAGWFAGVRRGLPDPILREAWGPILAPNGNSTVTIPSPPVMMLMNYPEGSVPPVEGLVLAPPEAAAFYRALHPNRGGAVYLQSTVNDALLGDALAASEGVRVLASAGQRSQVLPENGMRPMALRGRNALVIGSPGYSHLAARILANMPYSVYYDPSAKEEVIADAPPGSNPKHQFRPVRDENGQLKEVYGLLTVMPVSSGSGSGARLAVFSGITSAGPQAAMEFFASPASLGVLKARLAAQGIQGFPPSYQVVVHCVLDGTLAFSWTYQTHTVVSHPTLLG